MNVKKTLGLGVVSAALGLTLVGGGTFAYFSSTSTTSSSFNNGTLSLKSDPSVIVNLSNLKPGDSILRDFKLINDGTLNIPKVVLRTSSAITDALGDNGSHNFKDDIIVTFLANKDKQEAPLLVISLADLEKQSPDLVAREFSERSWAERSPALKPEPPIICSFNSPSRRLSSRRTIIRAIRLR